MNHYIGIDNSSLDHKVQVIDETGNKKSSFTIPNNLQGFAQLHEKLQSFSNAKIGLELPHGPLVDYLHHNEYCIYALNPLKVKRYKETVKVSGNKDDIIDSIAIAEYLRHNSSQIRELLYNSPEIEKLKNLSIVRERLVRDRTRHKNKLHFVIREYFPLHESLFSRFGDVVQLRMIIKYPTFKDLQSASDDELRTSLKLFRYSRPTLIEKVIKKIRIHDQLIAPESEYACRIEALTLCEILLTLRTGIQEIEKDMQNITENHRLGKIFRSLPGAGPINSARLLAIFGDNKERFDNFNGAQCYFGTAPKNYKSGNYHRVSIRRACNKAGRTVLYDHAFASLRWCPWAREYYDQQRSKNKKNSVAIRALSNKWVKIIFKLWKEEIFYDESKKTSSAA